jgi:hypothetical protein
MVLLLDEPDHVRIGTWIPLDRFERIGRRGDEDEDQEARDGKNRNRIEKPAEDIDEQETPPFTRREVPPEGGTYLRLLSCLTLAVDPSQLVTLPIFQTNVSLVGFSTRPLNLFL